MGNTLDMANTIKAQVQRPNMGGQISVPVTCHGRKMDFQMLQIPQLCQVLESFNLAESVII
jgi:hypothetical protein